MEKKISIILPVYNSEKTLDRCIYSILSQTYKNFELIIINDSSKDNSHEIINKYLEKDNRIILIDNDENKGVSKSRNLGIEKATGELTTFIDSDDYYEKDALKKMYDMIIEKNVDAVRFSFNRIEENKKYPIKYDTIYANTILKKEDIGLFESDLINNRLQAYLWLLITKTDIAKKIKFDENLGMMEDTLWYYNFIKNINNIYFSNEILYNYCTSIDSASNSEKNAIRNIKNMLYMQEKYFELFNNQEQKLKEAYTSLLCVIIENIFKIENSKISNEVKKEFYNEIKNNQSLKIIVDNTNFKLIRKDRRIIIKLLNKNKFKSLKRYCKFKYFIKKLIKIIKKFIYKVLGKLKFYKNKIAANLYYNKFKKNFHYNILDDVSVVDKIINDKYSLARFGDGEFKWILGIKQVSFQNDNIELSNKLNECLNDNLKNLLIGIPKPLNDLREYNSFAKKTWKLYIYMYGKKVNELIPKNREYADTNITRFYMDYKNKIKCKDRIENLKRIWNNKDIVIIEGEKTKLGVGNNLFENSKSIKRILAPSINAFDKYDEILEAAKEQDHNSLFLISLGPTATVLAYDLAKISYQAIDIGHIDVEYEWYLQNAKKKVPIKGKYVNEAREKGDLSNLKIDDEKYKNSIVKIIK